ncbi:MAG: VOC family protein [Dehalococcoidia bacterium]|nr:VOC family protein [Dehalococcoidia bacterium]
MSEAASTGTELLAFRPNMPVADLDAALAFYRDLLGFEAAHVEPGLAILRSGGAEVALVVDANPAPAGAYLYVRGVEGLHRRMLDAGMEVTRPLQQQPWGLHDFVVRDPDGHAIGIGEWIQPAA